MGQRLSKEKNSSKYFADEGRATNQTGTQFEAGGIGYRTEAPVLRAQNHPLVGLKTIRFKLVAAQGPREVQKSEALGTKLAAHLFA